MTDKETLLEEKKLCDLKLAKMKAKLAEVRADARLNRNYMEPVEYGKLVLKVSLLGQRSQAIQREIAEIKRNNKSIITINDCFRDAAAKVLPEKTFFEILDMAFEIKRARENYLTDD